MKWYIADVIETGLFFLCCLLGHVGGCWIIQGRWSPLRRLSFWATEVRLAGAADERGRCCVCGRSDPPPQTSSYGEIVFYDYDAATRKMVRRA
jgi:hypothetical protein